MIAGPLLPFVSVIVPVYNDAERLALCLEALNGQSYPRDRFEVIVVDNGSALPVRSQLSTHRGLRVIEEPRAGSYAARNAGIEAASGQLLAFTDADCLPSADWIAQAVAQAQSKPDVFVWGGPIQAQPDDLKQASIAELHQCVISFDQHRCLKSNFVMGANLIARREVFDSVGPFDPRIKSTGDLEWGQRASAAGFFPKLAADAIVKHPPRKHLKELVIRSLRIAGGYDQVARLRGQSRWHVARMIVRRMIYNVHRARQHELALSVRQRTLVMLTEILLRHLQLVELLRLSLGGKPRRQ